MSSKWTLYEGDCLSVLKTLPDDSVDAMITDPPSGKDIFKKAKWDDDKGGRDLWISWLSERMREAFRVLKPGAYGLVWAFSKTAHWTGMALENAGFEVSEKIVHLYSSGMPKNLDISKAFEKSLGVKPIGRLPASGVGFMNSAGEGGWNVTTHKLVMPETQTELGKKWKGYGTALSPSCEDWWLVQKPRVGTYVNNITEWGVGGLNIEASMIPTDENLNGGAYAKNPTPRELLFGEDAGNSWKRGGAGEYKQPKGRWPKNTIISHSSDCGNECVEYCAVRLLNEQVGTKKPASRFFYCPKPSVSEKTEGGIVKNDHPTPKSKELIKYFLNLICPPGGTVIDLFCGSGTVLVAANEEGFGAVGIELDPNYVEIIKNRLTTKDMIVIVAVIDLEKEMQSEIVL